VTRNVVFIARQHTDEQYSIHIANLSVRPSVRNVPVSDENGLTYCHSFFHHTVAQSFCFHQQSNILAKCRWGIKILRFSTHKSLHLANDARYRHSYYGKWIGTRMRSIKWCHFQWPWTNPNPVFKVTPLSDAKYLTNGYRHSHSHCLLDYCVGRH